MSLTAYLVCILSPLARWIAALEGGDLEWAVRAGGLYNDAGTCIAANADGGLWTAGRFEKDAVFGADDENRTTLASAGEWDLFVARYNSGGTPAWVKSAGGNYTEGAGGIAACDDESVVVTGAFGWGRDSTAVFGWGTDSEVTLTSAGSIDLFVARYDGNGALKWAKSAGGDYADAGTAVAALADGSVVVTGIFWDKAVFGRGESTQVELTSAGFSDIFVACYTAGGGLKWAKRAGGPGWDEGLGVAALANGSVAVTGRFGGEAVFGTGEGKATTLVPAGNSDIFVACYEKTGMLKWAKPAGGQGDDAGLAVAACAGGGALVTGLFEGRATFSAPETGVTTLESAGGSDIFIARYEATGGLEWARRAGGVGADEGAGIAAVGRTSRVAGAAGGPAIVTGRFSGRADFGLGEPGAVELVSAGGSDFFVARYDANGDLEWARRAGGKGADEGLGIAAAGETGILVTGRFAGLSIFGPGEEEESPLESAGADDLFIARYAASQAGPTPIPTAQVSVNGESFSPGQPLRAVFKSNKAIERPFTAFAVVILPDGTMLDAKTLTIDLQPVASNIPRLDAGFETTILEGLIPPGVPLGAYEIVGLFFDPAKRIEGRTDAFLDAGARFKLFPH